MKEIRLTLAETGMINTTRFVIGTGVGLLVAGKMDRKARTAAGISLLAAGILFSLPMGWSLLSKLRTVHGASPQTSDERAA